MKKPLRIKRTLSALDRIMHEEDLQTCVCTEKEFVEMIKRFHSTFKEQ